jgi:hypothetical protein
LLRVKVARKRSVFMPIAPISGSSAQPVRTSTEPAKGISADFKPKEKPDDAVAKLNKENNPLKPGVANNNEELKSVKEVDVKA